MTQEEANNLKKGTQILHTDYGQCEIIKVYEDMGVIIIPVTKFQKYKLALDSGGLIDTPLLESDVSLLKVL